MSDFTNRIDELLLKTNKRRADLVRGTGIGESTVRGWINGRAPNADSVYRVAKFLNVTMEYLVAGENEPSEIDPVDLLSYQEKRLLEHFRNLNDADKNAVITLATGLEAQYQKIVAN